VINHTNFDNDRFREYSYGGSNFALLHRNGLSPITVLHSVHARPKKLISGDCYTIFNLISSELKLISTLYVDFYVGS